MNWGLHQANEPVRGGSSKTGLSPIPRTWLFLGIAVTMMHVAAASPGDWPELRQNRHLTGFQPMAGRMAKAPEIVAEYDLGRSRPSIRPVALPDGGHAGLAIVSGALMCFDTSGEQRWNCHPPGLNFARIVTCRDLDGDGCLEVVLEAGRPAQPYGAAALVSIDDGRLIWRYDVEPMSYSWKLYAGSYLSDRNDEQLIVVMHAYPPDKLNGYTALFAFDESGTPPALRWRYAFHEYTCFPTLLTTDLDADGADEIVIETHSRMWFLDADTGALKHFAKWDVSPANKRSYGHIEFSDLNGDGREDFLCIADFAQHHEVLLNNNGAMEKAWSHGWGESVTTGKVATTWPTPPYADIDGDGRLEVVVSMFNSEGEQAWLVRVYDAVDGRLKYRAPGYIATVLADVDGDGTADVIANQCDDPTRTTMGEAAVFHVKDEVLSLLEGGEAVPSPPIAPAPSNPVDFSAVPAIQGPAYPVLLAADVAGDEQNELLVYREPTITILQLVDGELREFGKLESTCPPAIADFSGYGSFDIATIKATPNANPVVTVRDLKRSGGELWTIEFPDPPTPGLPQPRKAYLRHGRFTGHEGEDLYVWAGTPSVRSAVFEGQSGAIVWERCQVPNSERYWGPSVSFASAHDLNGDGCEDLVFTNPDYYCVSSGPTGEFLLGPLFPPKIFSQPSQGLYTYPTVLPRVDAEPLVCLVAGHYFQAAMSLTAQPFWYALPEAGQNRCAREGFLRLDDGAWLMGFGRQNGRFACINANDGTVRWETDIQASASDAVSCDVDGDGAAEFLFGTSHGSLSAIGDSQGNARPLWTLDLGVALGAPIAADVDGDGITEIAVPTSDGRVLVLGAGSE
ncbi:MAG: VCBS repeat-containing protein [bacterium]|nr:VCBS repeat-containing protein [bacterium]